MVSREFKGSRGAASVGSSVLMLYFQSCAVLWPRTTDRGGVAKWLNAAVLLNLPALLAFTDFRVFSIT